MIEVTPAAIQAAQAHQVAHPGSRAKQLRVWIADKNCEGFMYGVAFDDALAEDTRVEVPGLTVLLDPGTARYIGGAVLDFVDDARGRGFLVTHPQAGRFRGKFFLKGDPPESPKI